ncbi:HNH endonuclease [Aquisalimonas sp. APHAB1-3]|uniref:HNH endonuclease n=1 Tax=Aquisalimonas sp. APHAB1-3 TaxID=3402080 RepID=UPI003AAE9CB3
MHVHWTGDRCVICLGSAQLTKEHIIPASLGGRLTCDFLCKSCNSDVGAYVEAKAKHDPSVRLAVAQLQAQIPQLAAQLMEGQEFISHGPGGKSSGRVKSGEFRARPRKEPDGSLIQPTSEGRKSIEKLFGKSGMNQSPIEDALRRFDEAPDNQKVDLGSNLEAVKWSVDRIQPDLSQSVLLSPLVPLKIAYEFLACHLGHAIYDEARHMAELRKVLLERMEEHPCYSVERLSAKEYKPFHGIMFEGNAPHAQVQVRLFGWLAFRVHCKHLAVNGNRFIYTHFLDSGTEDVQTVALPVR